MTTNLHEGVCDQKRCWSDLPGDMVALIISRLRAPDCYCFVAVCKSWSSIPLPKFKKEFPTLVYLKSDGQLINFFSPLLCCSTPEIANSVYKNIITSDTTKFSSDIEDNEHDQCCQKGESDRSHCHEPKTIRFAKHGWLLVSQGKHVVFFLNPITNQRIDLPELPRSEVVFDGISFSESPTSPNCTVLAIHVQTYWVFPTFIRRGEDSWTSDPIYIESGFVPSYSSPVFHKGCFYFLGQTGCLAVFDPKIDEEEEEEEEEEEQEEDEEEEDEEEELDKWAVLDNPGNPCTSSPISDCYLVDCNGELMSVFVGYMGQWVRVYMLDPSIMVWKETKDLGDRVLFLSRIGSGLTKTTDLQVPGLENRIYFPRFNKKDGTCAFYDLSAGKFHTSCNNHGREDYYGTTTFSDCAWIEPSYRMLTDQELDWLHKEAS
ncbi:hypothetical protein POPTR_012G106800v4 [Populus trichocarpa]|uniref:Uncharacterized protein n=1 Tax=Populus trichocarpa TaxID=3694 RepID=A0ACC0S6M3_POPTR|nr:F-box protein At3g56470 [Populus trichocarpa]KAI9384762.1 hypothetical protein POPTR_012G106800v4 [Populus trichocarpa]